MNQNIYYPPAKAKGAWRAPQNDAELQELCGLSREKLDYAAKFQEYLNGGDTYGISIIRHGYLAAEYYAKNTRVNTTVHVHSCSKAMASLAFGVLLEEKKNEGFTLDSKAYDYIPEGFPLTDERKKDITVRHLLSMSAGFPGEGHGIIGTADVDPQDGEIEYILGQVKGRSGSDFSKLIYNPGEGWDYSCGAFGQLSVIFQRVAGQSMASYLQEKVLGKIGVEDAFWDESGGYGHLGPFTTPYIGFHVSARAFARIGYLLLQNGRWEGQQIVPEAYLREATSPSQPHNKDYGLAFWLNTEGSNSAIPKDVYAMKGYKANRLYIVPSLDLVISRVGEGPTNWDDNLLICGVIGAITD